MRITLVARLGKCQRGSVITEFALIAPVLFMLLFGILEYGVILFVTSAMESAITNSARMGKTGYVEAGMTREEFIYDMIETKVGGLLDASQVQIETKVYGEIQQIGEPEPFTDTNGNGAFDAGEIYDDINGNSQWDADMAAAGLGGAGDVVVYTVSYDWPVTTPLISYFISPQGTFPISSSIVVRNEPYDTVDIGG